MGFFRTLLVIFLTLFGGSALGGTLAVPGKYRTPCDAFRHLHDDDTVLVDAAKGPYNEGNCVIASNHVTIRSVNGRAVIDGEGIVLGKGLWESDGDGVVIEGFEFKNASKGRAVAGIRIGNGSKRMRRGGDVTIRYCYFHHNTNGILSDNANGGYEYANHDPHITVEYSEFYANGDGSGASHNIYIGWGGNMTFTMQYCYSHDAIVGHLVKSRALYNYILYNRLTNEAGTASYELNLPAGGTSYVVGNVIYEAPPKPNANELMITYRDEFDAPDKPAYPAPHQDLHFISNTVIADPANVNGRQYISMSCTRPDRADCPDPKTTTPLTQPAVIANNIFVGNPNWKITNQGNAELAHNLVLPNTPEILARLHFSDYEHCDFHLLAGSEAIGAADVSKDPKEQPQWEYAHPLARTTRPQAGKPDLGAFHHDPAYQRKTAKLTTLTSRVVAGQNLTVSLSGLRAPAAGERNFAIFRSGNPEVVRFIPTASSTGDTVTATFETLPVPAEEQLTVEAEARGVEATTTITVLPAPPALKGIADAVGPWTPDVKIMLNGPSPVPVTVALTAHSKDIYVPETLTIPAGVISQNAGAVLGGLWSPPNSRRVVEITATYSGVSKTFRKAVFSPAIHSFGPFSGKEFTVKGGEPLTTHFAMNLQGTPVGGADIEFRSARPEIIPNQTLHLPQGQYRFNDTSQVTLKTNPVSSPVTVQITASYNSSHKVAEVTVTP